MPATRAILMTSSGHETSWTVVSDFYIHFSLFTFHCCYYPCLCLWRGSVHITRITPFLLITLHFWHIGFTDALTFIFTPVVSGQWSVKPQWYLVKFSDNFSENSVVSDFSVHFPLPLTATAFHCPTAFFTAHFPLLLIFLWKLSFPS